MNDPVSTLYRAGSKAGRTLGEEDRHRQQTASGVLVSIVYASPCAGIPIHLRHTVIVCQDGIHKRITAIKHVEHGAIVADDVLHKPDRLLKHGFAQIIIESGEPLAIDCVCGFEVAEVEPVTGEFGRQSAYSFILEHAV